MKVDEQPRLETADLQICDQLSFVDWKQSPDSLCFDDELIIDDEIESISGIYDDALVVQRQRLLPLDGESASNELVAQALLVGRFQQPRPELPMHLHTCPNHGL